ncbi:MAG TPA: alpha/beta fold hydrolase [Cyclobacteriaceae bacterium]|jgi:haloalkane dehalogenase
MKTAPSWVDPSLFPFRSQWLKIGECELHYVDEGSGDVILFLHGTPEWSFGYRHVIGDLRPSLRCVAPDMLGFGLSEKPPGEEYTCKAHAERLEQLVKTLGLQNITIVANDFGGGIGLHYAVRNPQNVSAILLTNTWCWSVADDPRYAKPARVMRTWLGRFMYRQLNFPVNAIMPAAYADRKKLTREIHSHYRNALPDAASRIATYAFARELLDAGSWWESIRQQLGVLKDIPKAIVWGMGDKFVQPYELEKWRKLFPEARIVTLDNVGHFVHEEQPDVLAKEIRALISAKR